MKNLFLSQLTSALSVHLCVESTCAYTTGLKNVFLDPVRNSHCPWSMNVARVFCYVLLGGIYYRTCYKLDLHNL